MNQKFDNLIDQARKDFQAPVFMSRLRTQLFLSKRSKIRQGVLVTIIDYMKKTSLTFRIVSLGTLSLVVLATVLGLNPLSNKLSNNTPFPTAPQKTYAEQMLFSAMEKFNELPSDKRAEIQFQLSTNLVELWQEAQQASDLQFFSSFPEYDKAITDDTNNFSPVSKQNFAKHGKRDVDPAIDFQAFRFTDHRGMITYLIPSLGFNSLEIVIFNPTDDDPNLSYQDPPADQKEALQKTLEEAIQKKFPAIKQELTHAPDLQFTTDRATMVKFGQQEFNDAKAGKIKFDDESWKYLTTGSTNVTEIIYYKKTGLSAPPPYYEFRYTDPQGRLTIVSVPKPGSIPIRPIGVTKFEFVHQR